MSTLEEIPGGGAVQTNRGPSAGRTREALSWGLFTTAVAAMLVAVAGGGFLWTVIIAALGLLATGALWFGLRDAAAPSAPAGSPGQSQTPDDPGEDRHGA